MIPEGSRGETLPQPAPEQSDPAQSNQSNDKSTPPTHSHGKSQASRSIWETTSEVSLDKAMDRSLEQQSVSLTELLDIVDPPPEFQGRPTDFFTSGKYVRIWARDRDNIDAKLHDKSFILIDQQQPGATGMLVRWHDLGDDHDQRHVLEDSRSHVLLANHLHRDAPKSVRKVVYLEEDDDPVVEDTYIELENIYKIPFSTYQCMDLGALTHASVDKLREYYIDWLKFHWKI
jgi:hypothetical protein